MTLNYTFETSKKVINFLLKNSLINMVHDEDLYKLSKKLSLEKLNILLKYFPENQIQVTRIIRLIYALKHNIFIKDESDKLYLLDKFIFVKKLNWEFFIITFDPQLIIDYFNYLLPNTFVVSIIDYQNLNSKNLENISDKDLSQIIFNSDKLEIRSINEVSSWANLEKVSNHDAVKQLDEIIRSSISANVSDIHLEVDSDDSWSLFYRVRIRVDWMLKTIIISENLEVYSWIISQIKLRAWLKIDENRLPQDWRMIYWIFWKSYSFRISSKPIVIVKNAQGWDDRVEKIVIRKMPEVTCLNLEKLNYSKYQISQLKLSCESVNWFTIVTWPTWSWKTSLLYALLWEIDKVCKNVSTIEDPVEADIKWVSQTQVLSEIWLDFAKVLRSELRQDPDVIMVWEIRDLETAEIASEAALTWHLVFSTLHTKNAVSTITRLINMWVQPFIVASSLTFSIAQRLVKCLCNKCKKLDNNVIEFKNTHFYPFLKKQQNDKVKQELCEALSNLALYKRSDLWCSECLDTWYHWRTAIVEIFRLGKQTESVILKHHANESMLHEIALKWWMLNMEWDWMLKVMKWVTTIDEIYSVLSKN